MRGEKRGVVSEVGLPVNEETRTSDERDYDHSLSEALDRSNRLENVPPASETPRAGKRSDSFSDSASTQSF